MQYQYQYQLLGLLLVRQACHPIRSSSFYNATQLQTDLMAVHLAVKWAFLNNFNTANIYSDCLNVALQLGGNVVATKLRKFCWQIWLRIKLISFCRLSKVNHNVVQPAHDLAEYALAHFEPCPVTDSR